MKQLLLAHGTTSEVQKWLQGNTILIAQPQATIDQVMPCITNFLDSISVVFCVSKEDVKNCKALEVSRAEYLQCLHYRKQVCEAFADVVIDEHCSDLPMQGVPEALVQSAVSLPEAQKMASTMSSPWSAGMFAHKHTDDDAGDVKEDSSASESDMTASENAPAPSQQMIGIDYGQDPRPAQLFEAMQSKLQLLQKEIAKLVKKLSSNTDESDAPPVEDVAAEERVRRLIVDLQDVSKRLLRNKPAALESEISHTALAVPGGKALSCFDPHTWSCCFIEFFYGDAVPNLPDRPNKNLTFQKLFSALISREELEYSLATDDPTNPYVANALSRFDSPDFVAVFGDTLRRMKTMQMVTAAFERPGFEKDLHTICKVSAADFVAATTTQEPSIQGLIHGANAPQSVKTALRHLLFTTATVPLTDGYKTRLRHMGYAQNIVFGPLSVFTTHNYSDTHSPLVHQISQRSCESTKGMTSEMLERLMVTQEPCMPTLQDMHKLVARSPRSTAKFFLLMEELTYRHLYGIDRIKIGHHVVQPVANSHDRDDGWASSSVPALAGFSVAAFEPLEAQGRGFEHGHRKISGRPGTLNHLWEKILTHVKKTVQWIFPIGNATGQTETVFSTGAATDQTETVFSTVAATDQTETAATDQTETVFSTGAATDQTETVFSTGAATDQTKSVLCTQAVGDHNAKLKAAVASLQYESALLPGKQLGITLCVQSHLQKNKESKQGLTAKWKRMGKLFVRTWLWCRKRN